MTYREVAGTWHSIVDEDAAVVIRFNFFFLVDLIFLPLFLLFDFLFSIFLIFALLILQKGLCSLLLGGRTSTENLEPKRVLLHLALLTTGFWRDYASIGGDPRRALRARTFKCYSCSTRCQIRTDLTDHVGIVSCT